MKVMFLHLSDMHIKNQNGYNQFQLNKIADAVASKGPVDRILLLFTGDLAYSGKQSEYQTGWSCLNYVVTTIKKKMKAFFVSLETMMLIIQMKIV